MGETTDQIESQIATTREDLGLNLQELEEKVKSVTDWRQHFQKSPMTMVGVAFGGGVLLASMIGGSRSRSRRPMLAGTPEAGSQNSPATSRQAHAALETWDHIKGALIGVAAAQFKSFIGEMVPGFEEQFNKTAGSQPLSTPASAGRPSSSALTSP